MKKTLKLTLIAFGTLSLFACDGGPTTTKTTAPVEEVKPVISKYSITVTVQGLSTTNPENIQVVNGTDSIDTMVDVMNAPLSSNLVAGSTYNVVVMSKPTAQLCDITAGNSTSDNMNSDVGITVDCSDIPATPIVGNALDGKMYYMSECAVCHKAGVDDTITTFSGQDLASKYQLKANQAAKNDFIKSDMHDKGVVSSNFMGRFQNVDPMSIANLRAYLETAVLP